MPDQQTIDTVLIHLEYLRKAADETNGHLFRLNGRMADVETRTTILETRTEDARTSGAKWGAGLGAVVAGIIAGLSQAFGGK